MITLNSGRVIELSRLNQSLTYESALAGIPRTRINDHLIETFLGDVVKKTGYKPLLIKPVRTLSKGFPEIKEVRRALGSYEFLPAIACFAHFCSHPVRGERQDCSYAVIVWYQNSWAMPIDATIINQIKKVDWESLAENYTG